MSETLKELVKYVKRLEQIDETGDATLAAFIQEEVTKYLDDDHAFNDWSFSAILINYIQWTGGWEQLREQYPDTPKEVPQY